MAASTGPKNRTAVRRRFQRRTSAAHSAARSTGVSIVKRKRAPLFAASIPHRVTSSANCGKTRTPYGNVAGVVDHPSEGDLMKVVGRRRWAPRFLLRRALCQMQLDAPRQADGGSRSIHRPGQGAPAPRCWLHRQSYKTPRRTEECLLKPRGLLCQCQRTRNRVNCDIALLTAQRLLL